MFHKQRKFPSKTDKCIEKSFKLHESSDTSLGPGELDYQLI